MSHNQGVEALDHSLQDIRRNGTLMGGVVILLAGGLRQVLPVTERGTAADEINACLKELPLWIKVGEGRMLAEANGLITITSGIENIVSSEDILMIKVLPYLEQTLVNKDWLCERAILAPKNELVGKINNNMMGKVPDEISSYMSLDTVLTSDESTTHLEKFHNPLKRSGLPSHMLELKVGVPNVLIRNIYAPRLCNGTRLRITKLRLYIVHATILTEEAKAEQGTVIESSPTSGSVYPIIDYYLGTSVLCLIVLFRASAEVFNAEQRTHTYSH
ncbi:uncharacterized protein LOC106643928 [Copidosoma floridanum]|uniref:uncharacterized protein LOC106643928 n=1 Tax=Copidosoma floridanum TaxID=29053 RepID=UPI0006C980D7|nr:uncharacterized protein LOC106643928 [Copidosoma floridanum]